MVSPGGADYLTVPGISLAPPPSAPAGTTFTSVPAVAAPATGPGSILVKNKAIQELFDPTYGRMNATLGIELPFTSALAQTTIPLGYVDPVSEEIDDGETQIWKITHNGVDAHPVHFHLVNVQLINRIGWDGTVKPPMDNEYGWKETVRMNPLEDIVVAVRAKKPIINAGFGLPFSVRRADPSQPLNTPAGFTQVDVLTGNPKTVVNAEADYGWEYVWHCHILGHEENDFMRPIKFNANEAAPAAPTITSALDANGALIVNGSTVNLNWTDNATTEYKYEVYRTAVGAGGVPGTPVLVSKQLANSNKYSGALPSGNWIYTVAAVGAKDVGQTSVPIAMSVAAPSAFSASATSSSRVTLSWVDNSTNETRFVVQRSVNGGAFTQLTTLTAANTVGTGRVLTYTANNQSAGNTYQYRVFAEMVYTGGSVQSEAATATLVFDVPVAPQNLAVDINAIVRGTGRTGANQNLVPLTWTDSVTPANGVPATSYRVEWFSNAIPSVTGNQVVPASALGSNGTTVNVPRGTVGTTTYSFRVRGVSAVGNGASSTEVTGVATK
jgi:hypothetical protein